MAVGITDLKDLQLPATFDAGVLQRLAMRDGTTFAEVVAQFNAALGVLNNKLLTVHPYNLLAAPTTEETVEYPSGQTFRVQEATEYSAPDPQRGKMTGHMLPVKGYDISLGWTWQYLMNAKRSLIDADINTAIASASDHMQRMILQRLFKVEAETIGNSGKSVPFADGGASDPDYVPPPVDGKQFTAAHNHYVTTTALTQGDVDDAVWHLAEHGHQPPFLILASLSDGDAWRSLSGFKLPEMPGIVYRTETRAEGNIAQLYDGVVETPHGVGLVKFTARIPSGYFAVTKGYGAGDPRNPLLVRYDEQFGFGWRIVPGMFVNAPQFLAVAYAKYGVGVGRDRTAAVLVQTTGGSYTTPTIS